MREFSFVFFFSFESTRFFIILREWDPVATLRLACLLSLILFVYLFFISFQDQIRTRERERKKKTSLWPAHLLWSFFYHSRSRHTTNFSSFFFLSSYSNHDIYLYGLPPDEWEIGSQVWNDGQTSNVSHTHTPSFWVFSPPLQRDDDANKREALLPRYLWNEPKEENFFL
jgi:hypothetical protein